MLESGQLDVFHTQETLDSKKKNLERWWNRKRWYSEAIDFDRPMNFPWRAQHPYVLLFIFSFIAQHIRLRAANHGAALVRLLFTVTSERKLADKRERNVPSSEWQLQRFRTARCRRRTAPCRL